MGQKAQQGPSSRAASPTSWPHLPGPTWHGKPCPASPSYIILLCLPGGGGLSSLPRRLTPKEDYSTRNLSWGER